MKKLLKDITIGVIFSLFVIESIFTFKIPFIKANSQRTEINYSDKDYITLNITEKDKKYSFNIESKNLGTVDWIGYVFPLTPTQFESPDNFYEKTKSNRSIYTTEDQPLGIVYAKAKGFFRYLDILSTGVDWAMNKIFGNPFRDTLTIPSTEENIYLVRSYSGGWGKFTDPTEKSFVREKIYKGNERDRQAVVLNISLATFDTLGVFIPLADFLGDQLNTIIEAGLRKADKVTTAKAMGIEGSKEATKYLLHVAAETGEASLLKAGEIIKDEATQNFFKFIARSCKIAIKVVDVGRKISNAGQAVDRIVQMVTVATPLETSYVVVGNPLLALEKKETKEKPGLIEEIPEIIEKAGPAALVPKPPEEEKPKEEKQPVILKYRLCPPMNWVKEEVDLQIEASLGKWIEENLGLKMRWISFREAEGLWSTGYLDVQDYTKIGEHLWAVGDSEGLGFIFYSSDGGKSWELQWREPPEVFSRTYPFVVYFSTEKEGWMGSKDGLYYTQDGGRNWEFRDVSGEGFYIAEYWFYPNQRIDASYAYGGKYTSLDGGKTWK